MPKKLKKYAKRVLKCAKWLVSGMVAYTFMHTAAMCSIKASSETKFTKRIETKKELAQVVKEEAEKLGLNPSNITAELGNYTSYAQKTGSEYYYINIHYPTHAYRPIVKHELYHIHKGDCEDGLYGLRFLEYFFIEEPRANLYEAFDIRL